MTKLRLGTRKSLLAWAQSSWVARELERLNPGVQVELIGIETRGDKIQDVSLQSVAGKEFFVAELDEALAAKRVDFNVHSLKDLSLDRPSDFVTAAIPKRENPRDAVLFGLGIIEKLRAGRTIRVGTSSPRRLENIPVFLRKALPQLAGEARVEMIEIRGNVNTRLSRVQEPEGSEKHLDAVVLAFAGLIRLWRDHDGQDELRKLLAGVRWMVLPLKECPAAPGQGALAVECRSGDTETRELLETLHSGETEREVALERSLLAQWGGGCHQRFGATAIPIAGLRELMFVRGVKPGGEFVDEIRWKRPGRVIASRPWDGSEWKSQAQPTYIESKDLQGAVFVAHSRALPELWSMPRARIWTSGTQSWLKLAARGLWVEGCAEGLGFEQVRRTMEEPILGLGPSQEWTVLTHSGAERDWDIHENIQRVIATYRLEGTALPSLQLESLRSATDIFWSSASQFDELKKDAPRGARHACGPGKTASHLKRFGVDPQIFPNPEEWRRWLGI
jgi:hydroxymethylbilane synthase